MPVEIIAELAQGYEGNAALACLLAKAAVTAGADSVKFQCVYADEAVTPDYQYYSLFKSLEMPLEAWEEAASIVKGAGRRLYFDTAGEQSLRTAQQVGADGVKIHATNFYNTDLVRKALVTMPAVFISLGGISVEEIEEFIRYHGIQPDGKVRLLYGFQAEPTPVEANNLLRIGAIRKRFPGFPIGFMDHADGSSDDAQTLSILALPLGIAFIEKHLTLDRELQLEDFVSALPPAGFRKFVERIRRLEGALGSSHLELTDIERQYRRKVLRVVVAAEDIPKGTLLLREHVDLKRVGAVKETPIYRKGDAVGQKLRVYIKKNQQITREILE